MNRDTKIVVFVFTLIGIISAMSYDFYNSHFKVIPVLRDSNKEFSNKIASLESLNSEYRAIIVEMIEKMHVEDKAIGIGGSNSTYTDEELRNLYEGLLTEEENFMEEVGLYFDKREEAYKSIPNIFPIKYNSKNAITSFFGKRKDPFVEWKVREVEHTGVDITSVLGAEIVATADGYIQDHWIRHSIFGKHIIIDHQNGYDTMYAHLSVSYVHEGNFVRKGDVIGRMGDTGLAKGDHLHYEIRYKDKPIDPILFLEKYLKD